MRHIFLFSSINPFTSQDFIRQLLDLDRESNEDITIFINSGGGSVNEMFSMIDAMNIVNSKITTVVMGMAASAAAVIATNGDKRLITENSRFMLHEVWTIVGGSASEIEEQMSQVTKEQNKLIDVLAKKTGQGRDKILKDIKKQDKFFDAKESVRYGLADELLTQSAAKRFKLSEGINCPVFEVENYSENKLSEIQILKDGVFETEYGTLSITKEILSKMKENFDNNVRGIELSLDYTHDNDSGEKPAACWIKHLEVKNHNNGFGLFALVEFTSEGKKLVQEKAYKYASADFAISYADNNGNYFPYVLLGGTLTNRPVIKEMNPIKLSEHKTIEREASFMDKQTLINSLKVNFQIDVVDLQSSLESANTKVSELENKISQLSKLPAEKETEINNLKAELKKIQDDINAKAKEQAFNDLVREKKIAPAQKEVILNKFDSAQEIKDFYKDAPAVVNSKENGSGEDPLDNGLTPEEKALVQRGEMTEKDIIENRSV